MKSLKFEAKTSILALSICAAIALVGCGGGGGGGDSKGAHEGQLGAQFGNFPTMDVSGANVTYSEVNLRYSPISQSAAEAFNASIAADNETFVLGDIYSGYVEYDEAVDTMTIGPGYSYIDAAIYFNGNYSEVHMELDADSRIVALSEFDDIFPAVDGNVSEFEIDAGFGGADNSTARFNKFQDELIRGPLGGNATYCTGNNETYWECDYYDGTKRYYYEAYENTNSDDSYYFNLDNS
jgi:hypothetical protein